VVSLAGLSCTANTSKAETGWGRTALLQLTPRWGRRIINAFIVAVFAPGALEKKVGAAAGRP
jgi:hypothetical protein